MYRIVRRRRDRVTGRWFWVNVSDWFMTLEAAESMFSRVIQRSPNTHFRLIRQETIKERTPNATAI